MGRVSRFGDAGIAYPRVRGLKSFANKNLIPARPIALIFAAALLIEGVVDRDV
jgi:hypothetical protein